MTNKLTAKLSDGTEWEIVDKTATRFYGAKHFTHVFSAIPLKPEPPKEVFLELNGEPGLQYIKSYTLDRALFEGTKQHTGYMRYVLADEPKQEKQAREWWEVQDVRGDIISTHPASSREDAVEDLLRCKTLHPERSFRVVHVREVLG